MKKMMLVMAAATLVAGATVQAQSETVTSVNVVGYYSVSIPADGVALVTPILNQFDESPWSIEKFDGGQLRVQTKVHIWDRLQKKYLAASKTRSGWSGEGASSQLLRGDALWIVPPKDGQPTTFTVMGEVPAAYNNSATTTVENIDSTDAVGYVYPVSIKWVDTTLAQNLPAQAKIHVWSASEQKYETYGKTRSGWGSGTNLVIQAGQAFWVNTPTNMEWDEVAPYQLD